MSKEEEEEKAEIEDASKCGCESTSSCPLENVDYAFGTSCSFGFVRCCKLETEKETAIDQMVVTENEEDDDEKAEDEAPKKSAVDLLFPLVPSNSTIEKQEEASTEKPVEQKEATRSSSGTKVALTREQYLRYVRLIIARKAQLEYQNSFIGRLEASAKDVGDSVSNFFGWLIGNGSGRKI